MDESLKFKNRPMKAGFPNASEDSPFNQLNLHTLLIKRPSSTYFMRLDGSLLPKQYESTETLLIVDRSLKMRSGDVLVVSVRGEMVLKQFKQVKGRNWLLPVGEQGRALEMNYGEEILVWGVVLHIIDSIRGGSV